MEPVGASNARPIAVRIREEAQDDLALLARVTGVSISEHVRAAMVLYIFKRLNSDSLREEINEARQRFMDGLSLNLGGDGPPRASSVPQSALSDTPLSVRLDRTQESRLKGLALLDANSLADQLRTAIDDYLSGARLEDDFMRAREGLESLKVELGNIFAAVPAAEAEMPTYSEDQLDDEDACDRSALRPSWTRAYRRRDLGD